VHLVRVSARAAERPPTVDEVRPALRERWLERQRQTQRRAGLERLRRHYELRP
jgi:hypothetical protein